MTVESNEAIQLELFDLIGHLQDASLRACQKLAGLCSTGKPAHAELSRKFRSCVTDIDRVVIEALTDAQGAFIVQSGILRVAEDPISRLLTIVLNEVEQLIDANAKSVDGNEIPELLERLVVQYVFHELRHRTQGLSRYEDIQKLKGLDSSIVSDYDVFADRDAASAVAMIYAKDESRATYLELFRDALFFSTNYFFQVFPVPVNRPDKVARAMAILFMAARLARCNFENGVQEDVEFPLDAPLHVSLSMKTKKLAIHIGEPSRELLGTADNDDGVGELIDQICAQDFGSAIETSTRLMNKLQLLG
ncbi:hypothetical protein [Sphingobium sp. B12D2B]|uniref:hypothetical protein n=1 Tax=Sphingobium sp. B12D2B TaxID=2940577 RepID=UPI002224F5FA|nr:hypothetical protein [Sphingobium sp. B12D2B]MCW2351202.1 hypothetical protein [Sphingobium sp. B12D2B]